MKKFNSVFGKIAILSAMAIGLAACGGGGGSSSSDVPAPTPKPSVSEVSGTAAIGYPIVGGIVELKCSSGATASATTDTTGQWTASVNQEAFPCAIRVSGGTAGFNDLKNPLHSMATVSGIANITPLTDLMLGATSNQDPSAWFTNANNGDIASVVTPAAIENAQVMLLNALNSLPGKPVVPDGFNPLTTPFTATKGDAGDDLLESYGAALAASGLTQADAAKAVAAGKALTEKAFVATAFTTPSMTSFRAGSAITKAGDFILHLPDPNRGSINSKLTTDSNGVITGVQGRFSEFTNLHNNNIGQLCVPGAGTMNQNRQSEYVYLSDLWTPVTDITELYGKVFDDYENCFNSGIAEFKSDDSFVFTENGQQPDSPDFGISKAFTEAGMVDEEDGTVTRIKAFKANIDGKTIYAYIGVTSALKDAGAVIDGDKNYVTMGVTR